MMRYLRPILIILLAFLSAGFVVQFVMMSQEMQSISEGCARNPGFSCDAFPEHVVGGFHILSAILLVVVIFAKKYYWSMGIVITYFFLDIFATYARLGTGVFGGDMCPEGHPCLRAIRRASWFDWTAGAILMFASIIITLLVIGKYRTSRKIR